MFEKIKYSYELSRLHAKKKKIRADYDRKIRKENAGGNQRERIEELQQLMRTDLNYEDDRIGRLQTVYLRARADHFLIPTPVFETRGPDWVMAKMTGDWQLNPDARRSLREKIQLAERERWDRWTRRMVAITGLIGAIIGLVAVLKM